MIGGGAVIAAYAGSVADATDGRNAHPLQWIMVACAMLSWVSVIYVRRRARAVGAA